MSVEKIHLRKLLQLFYANTRLQRSLLLRDIREDRRKASRGGKGGGDFFSPFWADVKAHAAGLVDIRASTAERIAANKRRRRLYLALSESFLSMWAEKMRWRNEAFEFVPESIKARLPIPELSSVVKIENTVGVRIWDGSYRVIYPYFCEAPALPEEGVRLAFWVLSEALPNYRPNDFRIVDLQHRAYFRPSDIERHGDEQMEFLRKYESLLKAWRKLRDDGK